MPLPPTTNAASFGWKMPMCRVSPDLAPCLLDISLLGKRAVATPGAAYIAILALDGAGVDAIEGTIERRRTARVTFDVLRGRRVGTDRTVVDGRLADALP